MSISISTHDLSTLFIHNTAQTFSSLFPGCTIHPALSSCLSPSAGFRSPYLLFELPHQLVQLKRIDDLCSLFLNCDTFIVMYMRGLGNALLSAWKPVTDQVEDIVDRYILMARNLQQDAMDDEAQLYLSSILFESLGRFMRDVNILPKAAELLQRALEIREQILDPDHISVARAMHHLATVHTAWEKPQLAQALLHQAMDITRSSVGAQSVQMADHLDALAAAAMKEKRHNEAEDLRQQAERVRQKANKQRSQKDRFNQTMTFDNGLALSAALDDAAMLAAPPSAEHARSLNELGVLYFLQRDHAAAEKCFVRALEMREELLGDSSPDVAQSLNNLAALYNDLGRFEEAEPLYLRALAMRRKVFHDTHASVATTVNQLGALYRKQGKYTNALPLYRHALEIREKSFGLSHPSVATALNNLAVVYCQLNDHEHAAPLYENALRIYEQALGGNHPRVAETLRNLAVLKYDMGLYEAATQLYKRATDISDVDTATPIMQQHSDCNSPVSNDLFPS